MPVITPKSPEVLQAQTAAFAAEYAGYGDGRDIVREIGNSGVGMEVSFDTPPSQRKWLVSSREKEYVEFLRENGGRASYDISRRTEMIEAYEDFAPAAEAVLADLAEIKTREWQDHPVHIGVPGRTANAFVIEHGGQEYVLRVPREENFGIDREYIAPAVRAHGNKSTEQMVAVSYEKGVTISERMPGKTMAEMSVAEVAQIKEEHLSGLVDTLADIHKTGLLFDTNPGNTLYHPDSGFGVIDLFDKNANPSFVIDGMSIDFILSSGADVLLYPLAAIESRANQNIAPLHKTYKAFIPIIKKYRDYCMTKFVDDEMLPMIEMRLDAKLANLHNMMNYARRNAWQKTKPTWRPRPDMRPRP